MKKITLLLLIGISLCSCKSENDEVKVPVSPVLNPTADLSKDFYDTHGLYDGEGTVNAEGKMVYNILMPLLKDGKYSFVSFYNLGDNVLFMQMQDPDFDPSAKNVIYTLKENIMPLDMDTKEEISVYLYFENGAVLSQAEAKRIYRRGCTAMTEPKKCGTGVLSFSEE